MSVENLFKKKYPDCMREHCTCIDAHEYLSCIQSQMNKKEQEEKSKPRKDE